MAEVSLKKSTIYFNTIHKEKKAVNFTFGRKSSILGDVGGWREVGKLAVGFLFKIEALRLFSRFLKGKGFKMIIGRGALIQTYNNKP